MTLSHQEIYAWTAACMVGLAPPHAPWLVAPRGSEGKIEASGHVREVGEGLSR